MLGFFMPQIDWPGSLKAARSEQIQLAQQVQLTPLKKTVQYVAGVDVAFPNKGKTTRAAAVLLTLPELRLVESQVVELPTELPYIPGALSYREGNALIQVIQKLTQQPDVIMFDGQGILHPLRLGIASHVGVLLNYPSFGVGKSLLCGTHAELALQQGAMEEIQFKSDVVGVAYRSRNKVKPIYISPGHLITKQQAVELAVLCLNGYRLPEPVRLADKLSKQQL